MTGRVVALVEPNRGGHRFAYVRLLAEAALERGLLPVLLTDREHLGTVEYSVHLRKLIDGGRLLLVTPPTIHASDLGYRRVRSATKALSEFARVNPLVGPRGISKIIFMEGDSQLLGLLLFTQSRRFRGKFATLIMRPVRPSARHPKGFGRALLKCSAVAASRNSRIKVYNLVPLAADEHRGPWSLADPVEVIVPQGTRTEVRRGLGLPPDARLIGVFGKIGARKNVPLIVAAIIDSPNDVDSHLVLVGQVTPKLKETLMSRDRPDGRLVVIDQYVDDTVLDSYIYSMDAVVAAHSNDGPSGVVARAVMLGTPAVVAGSATLLRMAETSDLIETALLDPESLASAIDRACALPRRATINAREASELGRLLD